MSLLFTDSFDHYTTTERLNKWTNFIGVADSTTIVAGGRRSSSSLRVPNGRGLERSLSPTGATCVVGFAWQASVLSNAEVFRILDATVQHISLGVKSDGAIEVRRGTSSGTILGTSTAGLVVANTYVYIELKVLIDDASGTVEVRVNGSASPAINLTGQDTRNGGTAGWTRVAVFNGGISGTVDYDDLYVCDGNGSAPWNTFLGDVRVDAQRPNANGANSGSTPSTGTDRYATVDETTPNSDTDYNTIAGVGDKDTLNVESLAAAGSAILGIQVLLWVKKTDAGVGSACPVVRHAGADYAGASEALSTAYSYLRQVYQTNPGTSAQFTEGDFNSLEVGYQRTA